MLRRRENVLLTAGGVLALLGVGLLAYGFSLRVPFLWDDMIHFRYLQASSWRGIWQAIQVYGYYRPLPFTIWKALSLLQGHHDLLTLHWLNLGLHLLNGLLIFGLIRTVQRRQRGRWLGLSAAMLFLLFPSSYQVVPWIAALTHPLATALILGSLLLYRLSRRSAGRRPLLWAASLALASLAPFAHQTGVLIAPLLLLLLLLDEQRLPPLKALRETAPYWLFTAVGIGAWLVVAKGARQSELLHFEGRWQNSFYYLQALAYPVAPLAGSLFRACPGLGDQRAVLLVSAPLIAAWALALWRLGRGKLVALALGWFVLAGAPAWAFTPYSHTIDSPRLLYEASVGAALLWAIPLDVAWSSRRRSLLGTVLAGLVVVGTSLASYQFIRARVPIYRQMRLLTEGVLAARPASADTPVLGVNLPAWIGPTRSTYAIGHEGVVMDTGPTWLGDLLWLYTGQEWEAQKAAFPDILKPWRYSYGMPDAVETRDSIQVKLRAAKRVIVTSYGQPDIAVYDAGGLEAVGRPRAQAYLAAFGGRIALLAASCGREGSAARLEVRWQCWEPPAQETTVFLHLYDPAGRLVAQADGLPLMGTSRPVLWQPGDEWRDVRMLQVPAGLAPGRYTVKVGLYPVDGGPRLAATDPAGQRFQDEAVPVMALDLP